MKKNLIFSIIILAIAAWQCSRTDQESSQNLNLKESISQSAEKINIAFEKISASKGYQLLSLSEVSAKSDYDFHDSIDLELVAGVYDFMPDSVMRHNNFFPFRLFSKTGPSSELIVNLPQSLVFHPRRLHFFAHSDSTLINDFTIDATDYHFYYTIWNASDYKLIASFSLNSENIGDLDMFSTWRTGSDNKFSTDFKFPEGYSVIRSGQTGDTTRMIFALARGTDTLLKEDVRFVGHGFQRKERQYTLGIGNVTLKKASGIDSIQVYLNGILQKKAAAKTLDYGDYNSSICNKRDIVLTFDDGTTQKLSDLISPALTTLRSLSQGLGEMYLSKHVIDYIALSIYYNSH
jgi:hypothetical protein